MGAYISRLRDKAGARPARSCTSPSSDRARSGGYYGAKLARPGERVTFIARGAHLKAIRDRGLLVWSPLGDFVVRAEADSEPERIGPVDLVILAVKTYHNAEVLPRLGGALRARDRRC